MDATLIYPGGLTVTQRGVTVMQEPEESDVYPDDVDRKSGILTPSQRRFLLDGDKTGNSARQVRYRIRQRLAEALRDMAYLNEMRREDIQKAFDDYREAESEQHDDPRFSSAAGVFSLLYTGLGNNNFTTAMEAGVRGAITLRELDERGLYPAIQQQFHVRIDREESVRVEETLEKLKQAGGEIPPWVTPQHYYALVAADRLDELPDGQRRLLEMQLERKFESKERQRTHERIESSSATGIRLLEPILNTGEFDEKIEKRKQEIVEETLEAPSEWGLTVDHIALLEEAGFFDEAVDGTADAYRDRYRYVAHLHECSGLIEYENRQERDALEVTPDMFDREMEQAHKKRAEELLKQYRTNGSLTMAQFDCLLSEGLVDEEEIREEYMAAFDDERDEWSGTMLPPEYHG